MQVTEELSKIVQQRTWDKELLLWLGSESSLQSALASVHVEVVDLLDLFDYGSIPIDDDEIRRHLSRTLQHRLKTIQRTPGERTALIIRSAGILARYRVGVQDFYNWFCNDFSMVILLVEGRCIDKTWPDYIECNTDRLIEYFNGMVKRQFGV